MGCVDGRTDRETDRMKGKRQIAERERGKWLDTFIFLEDFPIMIASN